MPEAYHRRNPDELLSEIELEERRRERGKLKLFLGYASGVGKSFQMLDEARRRSERGQDVVIVALQPNYPPVVQAILKHLEAIPTVQMDHTEVINLEAVIQRRPGVAVIDGLAYDNPPGALHAHRWQDVERLLDAGISVLTTVNIQYLEILQQEIERITGRRADFIIPQSFLENSVDEITVVDAPSEESAFDEIVDPAKRLAEKHKLSRLRELALLVAASIVDRQLEAYLRAQGIDPTWGVQERILVYITAGSIARRMLESGRRNADRFQGEFHVTYLDPGNASKDGKDVLAENLKFANELGAEIHLLSGCDPVEGILRYARQKGITQIFVGRGSVIPGAWTRLRGDVPARLIRAAEGIDVVVFPES